MRLPACRRIAIVTLSTAPWIAGAGLVAVCWVLAANSLPEIVLPHPERVLTALAREPGVYLDGAANTATEAGLGLLIATVGSLLIISIVAMAPRAEGVFYPYIVLLKATPAVAFVPIFVVLAGIGIWPKILVAAAISFFPIAIGGLSGIRRTPSKVLLMASGYGCGRWRLLAHVTRFYAMRDFLVGMQTAAPLSVVGAMVGEYVAGGSPRGLGTLLMSGYVNTNMVSVFGSALMASGLGLSFFAIAYAMLSLARSRLNV